MLGIGLAVADALEDHERAVTGGGVRDVGVGMKKRLVLLSDVVPGIVTASSVCRPPATSLVTVK
ncbi:hypothetical protein MARA_60480 [Mycolicibacterium arabiense]|uniref:Uncharacterized protein n=1 Tax=Mycolicibacterium arabiense TaxID=1286181 RepID=A0A7I7S7X0_9MYCO|nr:hypothetical protein MARA_60480 [Mycolicibacterium arabiense]